MAFRVSENPGAHSFSPERVPHALRGVPTTVGFKKTIEYLAGGLRARTLVLERAKPEAWAGRTGPGGAPGDSKVGTLRTNCVPNPDGSTLTLRREHGSAHESDKESDAQDGSKPARDAPGEGVAEVLLQVDLDPLVRVLAQQTHRTSESQPYAGLPDAACLEQAAERIVRRCSVGRDGGLHRVRLELGANFEGTEVWLESEQGHVSVRIRSEEPERAQALAAVLKPRLGRRGISEVNVD
ncbi:MAG TPA: hypothetical protein VHM70_13670 [Polyangiaceae bacterium]|nr:hypothetical protein [Polyangiaceae bacterium]